VGEEVTKGTIVTSPTSSPRAEWAVVKHHGDERQEGKRYGKGPRLDSRDPLGLCNLGDEVRRRGFVLMKVLGGVSVLGAVVVAVSRVAGWEVGGPQSGWWEWVVGAAE
jgi:hypothetical protein